MNLRGLTIEQTFNFILTKDEVGKSLHGEEGFPRIGATLGLAVMFLASMIPRELRPKDGDKPAESSQLAIALCKFAAEFVRAESQFSYAPEGPKRT